MEVKEISLDVVLDKVVFGLVFIVNEFGYFGFLFFYMYKNCLDKMIYKIFLGWKLLYMYLLILKFLGW